MTLHVRCVMPEREMNACSADDCVFTFKVLPVKEYDTELSLIKHPDNNELLSSIVGPLLTVQIKSH